MTRLKDLIRQVLPPPEKPVPDLTRQEIARAVEIGKTWAHKPARFVKKRFVYLANVHNVPPRWRTAWVIAARNAWAAERRHRRIEGDVA